MYRVVILAAAALLVAIAVRPVRADDRSVCVYGTVDEAIAACSRLLAVNPKDASRLRRPRHRLQP
jgi:cob(I)alamin adenosyltransferase